MSFIPFHESDEFFNNKLYSILIANWLFKMEKYKPQIRFQAFNIKFCLFY